MPRRYYRRRTVVVRPKKKWASNMQTGTLENTGTSMYKIIVENSTQNATPTPIILKVGNIKLQGDVHMVNATTATINPSFVVLVYYLPEGIGLGAGTASTVISQHPEWIMAWKLIDTSSMLSNATYSGPSFSVSSRLKRNLNSGDRICVGFVTDITGNSSVRVNFAVQYWTCAN